MGKPGRSTEAVARALGVKTAETVKRWCKAGLPHERVGRTYRVLGTDAAIKKWRKEWLASRRPKAKPPLPSVLLEVFERRGGQLGGSWARLQAVGWAARSCKLCASDCKEFSGSLETPATKKWGVHVLARREKRAGLERVERVRLRCGRCLARLGPLVPVERVHPADLELIP